MKGSILIFGGLEQDRQREAEKLANIKDTKKHVDLLIVTPEDTKKSIGIKQIRESTAFLGEKPYSGDTKTVLILKGDKMTVQAQNALLKTLEEPPSYALIVLTAKNEKSLLETVVSRCRKVYIRRVAKEVTEPAFQFKDMLNMTIVERMDRVKDVSKDDSDAIIKTLEQWVEESRGMLKTGSNSKAQSHNIQEILSIKKDLENTNVSKQLALEKLVLSLL